MQGPVNIFPSLRTIRDANIEGLKHDPEIKFVLSDLELERGETDEGDASTDVGAAAEGVGADAGVVHEQFAPEAPAVFEPMDGVTPAGEATAAAAAAGEEAAALAMEDAREEEAVAEEANPAAEAAPKAAPGGEVEVEEEEVHRARLLPPQSAAPPPASKPITAGACPRPRP